MFLRLMCVMIDENPKHLSMQPTVCYDCESSKNLKFVANLLKAKRHHFETIVFQLDVIKELRNLVRRRSTKDLHIPVAKPGEYTEVIVEDPDEPPSKRARLDNNSQAQNDDLILLQPIIPQIDLCDIDTDDEDEIIEQEIKKPEEDKTTQEAVIKLSVENVDSKPIIEPLTNDEIEFLMLNFKSLTCEQQNKILNILHHLQTTEPERFKMLQSPF